MTRRHWSVSVTVALALACAPRAWMHAASGSAPPGVHGSRYLTPAPHPDERFANIFSRTVAYTADGMDDLVFRASGTAVYTVLEITPASLVFDLRSRYDGRPESRGNYEIKDGGRTACYKEAACAPVTDASGLLYNPLQWGDASWTLRVGARRQLSLAYPWELGPPGTQTVTVVAIDPPTHAVTLQREGSGDGFFDHDARQLHLTKDGKSVQFDVEPGRAHWTGYTTFREGVVISDELLVQRPLTFVSAELGRVSGAEREYILLNAMPPDPR